MNAADPHHRPAPTAALARILFIGDVVGTLGLDTIETLLPDLRTAHKVDFVVANGENSIENGAGIDQRTAGRLVAAGVDVITTGNHAHDAPGASDLYRSPAPVVRPDNLAGSTVGSPSIVVERYGIKLGVANVIGADAGRDPNRLIDDVTRALELLIGRTDLIVLDVHAGWPATKLALATMLDGRICAVIGTHTHIPTADARVLSGGTAYISDVGMTGARDAVIGFRPDDMINLLDCQDDALPRPNETGEGVLMAALITASVDGRALGIEHLITRTSRPKRSNVDAPRNYVRPNASSRPHRQPSAAVFDCDGLLVDTALAWRQAYECTLEELGRTLTSVLLETLNGASVKGAAATLNVEPETLHAALAIAFDTTDLTPLPGASELLKRLSNRIPIAIATNGPRELAELALERAGLKNDAPIVSAERMRGKPAPDVYLAACAHIGVEPSQAVAFEDSPVGAAAAKAAGLGLIYVPSGRPALVEPDLTVDRLDDSRILTLFDLEA